MIAAALLSRPQGVADLPAALSGTLKSALQPLVDLSGKVLGSECLLRGQRPPDELLAWALGEGWGEALDRRAAALGLEAAVRWLKADELVFVNALPMPLAKLESWLTYVVASANAAGVALERVVVELNENQPGSDLAPLRALLDRFRSLGLGFALDDVDGSERCLRFITDLRPEYVKLDGALVQALEVPATLAKVRRVLEACRSVGGKAIAEKVETEKQVDQLVALGVGYFQGWLMGRPVIDASPSDVEWRRAS